MSREAKTGKSQQSFFFEMRPPLENCGDLQIPEPGVLAVKCAMIESTNSQVFTFRRSNFGWCEANRDEDYADFAGRLAELNGVTDFDATMREVESGIKSFFTEVAEHRA